MGNRRLRNRPAGGCLRLTSMHHTPIRVLVADDHRLFRDGLRALLNSAEDLELVGEAGDGKAVVAQAAVLQPDVILMALRKRRTNAIEQARAIPEMTTAELMLVLTMFED